MSKLHARTLTRAGRRQAAVHRVAGDMGAAVKVCRAGRLAGRAADRARRV